jgi:hypothetical protein
MLKQIVELREFASGSAITPLLHALVLPEARPS